MARFPEVPNRSRTGLAHLAAQGQRLIWPRLDVGDERGARLGPGASPIPGTAVTPGIDGSHRNVIDRLDLIGGANWGRAGQAGPVDDVAENVTVSGQRVSDEASSPGPENEHARTGVRRRSFPGSSGRADLGVSINVELPRNLSAASRARRLLEELLAGRLEATQLDRCKLLTSELVNNAVLHGRGTITLRVDLDDARLRAEVIDEGSGFERVVRDNALDHLGGWGLMLVEAESSRWGVHEGGTHVWFEIEQPGPSLGEDKSPTQPTATDRRGHRPGSVGQLHAV